MGHLGTKEMSNDKLFVSSPYKGLEHHLDLTSIPETSKQVALALEKLQPVTTEYPSQLYSESFNWQEITDSLPSDFSGTHLLNSCQLQGNSIVSYSIQHCVPMQIPQNCII